MDGETQSCRLFKMELKGDEFIFFTDNPGKEELRREEKKLVTDRICKNNLLRGTAFYKGKVVAEEEKTGFTNKGQFVALLIK